MSNNRNSLTIAASDTEQGVVLLSITVDGLTNTAKLEGNLCVA